jgi:glycosyltransferase involved in cell wall biosynthesis
MRVIGMMCCLNEEEFLEDFFKHNLPLVDLMVIAEGGVKGNIWKTYTGRSIDNTNHILEVYRARYPDKIKVILRDNPWNSKQQQQNSMLKYVNEGDWIWVMAGDEIYFPDARKKLERVIKKYPDATDITFPIVNFFNDTKNVIVDKEFNSVSTLRRHQRFFKYKDNFKWVNHPTINDMARNVDTFFDGKYTQTKINLGMEKRFEIYRYRSDLMGIWDYDKNNTVLYYHYGGCRDYMSRLRKHIYYLMRDRNMSALGAFDFLMKETSNDSNVIYGYIEQIHQSAEVDAREYNGVHPLINKKWIKSKIDLKNIFKSIDGFDEVPVK